MQLIESIFILLDFSTIHFLFHGLLSEIQKSLSVLFNFSLLRLDMTIF